MFVFFFKYRCNWLVGFELIDFEGVFILRDFGIEKKLFFVMFYVVLYIRK